MDPKTIAIEKAYIARVEAFGVVQDHFQQGGFKSYKDGQKCMDRIKDIPAADVVEVRHGTWLATDAYPHNIYCSKCYKIFAQEHWEIWQDGSLPRDYCPSCGAIMDGGHDDVHT